MNEQDMKFFELGKKEGRKEMLAEILKALGIDELIADAIAKHEEQMHDGD